MNQAAHNLMSQDEFLLWCLDQEARYELVDGVPIEMMTGASNRHDQIIINIIAVLHGQLRGTPCRPATADIAVKIRRNSVRRPDVTVTCDPPLPDTYDAEKARMVVEVLSPSNRGVAWQRKLEEYHARDGLSYILIVESEKAGALLIHRENDETPWDEETFETMDQTIPLPHIGCHLTLADIYDGISFESA